MEVQTIPCPYCNNAKEHTFWVSENGYTAVKCDECGFVFLNPRPNADSISEAKKYGVHFTATGKTYSVTGNFRQYRVNAFRERIATLLSVEDIREKRWLDVGAGFGELILALQTYTDNRIVAEGIELNLDKVARAQSKGIAISATPLAEVTGRYDYISLVNVFSHLPDPLTMFKELYERLHPGGQLLVVTGNGADIDAKDFPGVYDFPDHLMYAGKKHISGMLKAADFNPVTIHEFEEFLPRPVIYRIAGLILRRQPLWNRGPSRSLWVLATKPQQ